MLPKLFSNFFSKTQTVCIRSRTFGFSSGKAAKWRLPSSIVIAQMIFCLGCDQTRVRVKKPSTIWTERSRGENDRGYTPELESFVAALVGSASVTARGLPHRVCH